MTPTEQTAKKVKKVTVGVTLLPDQRDDVLKLATLREWPVAKAGQYLIKLGLEKLNELQSAALADSARRTR